MPLPPQYRLHRTRILCEGFHHVVAACVRVGAIAASFHLEIFRLEHRHDFRLKFRRDLQEFHRLFLRAMHRLHQRTCRVRFPLDLALDLAVFVRSEEHTSELQSRI